MTLISQIIETFFYLVSASDINLSSQLLLSSLLPVKPGPRLTKKEREEFALPDNLNPNLFPFREECTGQKS
jgi:hypothetical protein